MKIRMLAPSIALAAFSFSAALTNGAVITPTATGFSVVVTAADLGTPFNLPDPNSPPMPLLVNEPGLQIEVHNDTGVTLDLITLQFELPPLGSGVDALAISSPDLGLDPPQGPGVVDLLPVPAGIQTFTIGGGGPGIADDNDATPDGTFLILYSQSGQGALPFNTTTLLVTPEPSATMLMGLGLLGFAMRRRR